MSQEEKLPKILIVEDDERLARLTQEYLIRNGLEVGVETDGNRAIRRIISEQPDLVVLDEPASGLDIETEQVIQSVLEDYFKETTQLIIAHRDATIRKATRRLYIQDGYIIKDDQLISVNKEENGDES